MVTWQVRGPPDQLHIGGLGLGELFGFLPTPPGVGLGVGIGTYAGRISLSITCDRSLLGDAAAELLGRCTVCSSKLSASRAHLLPPHCC